MTDDEIVWTLSCSWIPELARNPTSEESALFLALYRTMQNIDRGTAEEECAANHRAIAECNRL